jgi:hypothetical protein
MSIRLTASVRRSMRRARRSNAFGDRCSAADPLRTCRAIASKVNAPNLTATGDLPSLEK